MEQVNVSTWRPSLVTLHDGRQVLSDSEEWRIECLAAKVLDMPTRDERRQWLDAWSKRHGEASCKALEQHIVAIWEARKRQTAGQEPEAREVCEG